MSELRDLIDRALVAVSVAERDGFTNTAQSLIELAASLHAAAVEAEGQDVGKIATDTPRSSSRF